MPCFKLEIGARLGNRKQPMRRTCNGICDSSGNKNNKKTKDNKRTQKKQSPAPGKKDSAAQ